MGISRRAFGVGCFFQGLLWGANAQAQPHGAGWGDLSGRFVYGGEPPERQPLKITKDKNYCGKCKLLEEELIVNRKTKGLANVVVWLYASPRGPQPPVHESYKATEEARVTLDSTKCRINPHVRLLRTSQELLIRNTDPIGDGMKIDTFRNSSINLVLVEGAEVKHRFPNPERMPARVSCPVHPWESGWLLIMPHPYMAVSDTQGRFEIKGLPTGKWTFQFWQEKAGYVDEVVRDGRSLNWKRGQLEVNVQEGSNDLGTLELPPALFNT